MPPTDSRSGRPFPRVRQHTFDELESSLCGLTALYEARTELRAGIRAEVIRAKDRARFASRNPKVDEARRAVKAEMVEWMLIWLGDPLLFPVWIEARRRQTGRAQTAAPWS